MRVESLSDFDPQVDPVVLGQEKVDVYVEFAPGFRLRDDKFGPYNSTSIKLPTYAAVFLLAKNVAKVQ